MRMLSKSEVGPLCLLEAKSILVFSSELGKVFFSMEVTKSLECFCLAFLFKIKVFVSSDLRGTL